MTIEKYLKTHKDQHAYCEAIIFPDGTIEDAIPSHLEKLIKITGEERDVICEKMLMNAGPVAWLVDYTNCCSIWYNFGMLPENLSKEQEETIRKLKEAGQLSNDFVAIKNYEMRICSIHKELLSCDDEGKRKELINELDNITER